MKRTDVGGDAARTPEAPDASATRDALREALADHAVLRQLSVTVEHALAVTCGPRDGDRYRLFLDWGTPRVGDDGVVQRLTVRVSGDGPGDTSTALLARASTILTTLPQQHQGPLVRIALRGVGAHARVFDVLFRLPPGPE